MTKLRVVEVINLAGSVASITGISLLWLREQTPSLNLLTAIPICSIAALLVIAAVTAAYLILVGDHRIFASAFGTAGRTLYWSVALALVIFFGSLAIGLIFTVANVALKQL